MRRERVLQVVLVLVGLFFLAGIYPLITSIRDGWQVNKEDATPMGLSLYVMQGIFLLLAVRNPSAVAASSRSQPGSTSRTPPP